MPRPNFHLHTADPGEAGIFDYPAGYDDLLVALASSTIRPQQFGEV